MDKHGHVVGYRVTIINRDFEDSSDFKWRLPLVVNRVGVSDIWKCIGNDKILLNCC